MRFGESSGVVACSVTKRVQIAEFSTIIGHQAF